MWTRDDGNTRPWRGLAIEMVKHALAALLQILSDDFPSRGYLFESTWC